MMVPSGASLVITASLVEVYVGPSTIVGILAFVGLILIIAGVIKEFAE